MNIADVIPIIDIKAKECNAGCFANNKTPTPNIVEITESIIEALNVAIVVILFFVWLCKPVVIKIL